MAQEFIDVCTLVEKDAREKVEEYLDFIDERLDSIICDSEKLDSLLHTSVKYQRTAILMRLLERGANPFIINRDNRTPKQMALDMLSFDTFHLLEMAEKYWIKEFLPPPPQTIIHRAISTDAQTKKIPPIDLCDSNDEETPDNNLSPPNKSRIKIAHSKLSTTSFKPKRSYYRIGCWTPSEDRSLMEFVEEISKSNDYQRRGKAFWDKVSLRLLGRTTQACRVRHHILNKNRSYFGTEETK